MKVISLLFGKNRVLSLLFTISTLFALSMNLITPLQSLFIESLGADALEIGLVMSAQGFVSTLLMIPSGLLTERIGGKKTLFVSAVLAIIAPLMYASSKSWQGLSPWAVVYGAVFPTFIVTRLSLIAEESSLQNRATVYDS